jgi:hypothetical protein
VLCYSLQLLSEIFFILRRIQRDTIINVHRSLRKLPHYSCQVLMKLEISWQIFENYSNTKFHENPSSGSRVVPMWTDGQTGKTKLIVAFRSFANAPKIYQFSNE